MEKQMRKLLIHIWQADKSSYCFSTKTSELHANQHFYFFSTIRYN